MIGCNKVTTMKIIQMVGQFALIWTGALDDINRNTTLTFFEANDVCKCLFGTTLASIHSLEENEIVKEMMIKSMILPGNVPELAKDDLTIGLTRLIENSTELTDDFYWLDGSKLDYFKWEQTTRDEPGENDIYVQVERQISTFNWYGRNSLPEIPFQRWFLCFNDKKLEYNYPINLKYTILSLDGILFFIILYLVYISFKKKKNRNILYGIIFILISNIIILFDRRDFECISWIWVFGIGRSIIAIPILRRMMKLYKNMEFSNSFNLTNILVEILLCTSYTVIHQFNGGSEKKFNLKELRFERECNDDSSTIFVLILYHLYTLLLLLGIVYYSYGVRKMLRLKNTSVFKDSTCSYAIAFLIFFIFIISFAFYLTTEELTFRISIISFGVIISLFAILGSYYTVFLQKNDEDDEDEDEVIRNYDDDNIIIDELKEIEVDELKEIEPN